MNLYKKEKAYFFSIILLLLLLIPQFIFSFTPTPMPTVTPCCSNPPTIPEYKNIALNKPTGSSSCYSSAYITNYINDGDMNTVWGSSTDNGTQWVYIDLLKIERIDGIRIYWFNNYFARSYSIYLSDDKSNWSLAGNINKTNGNPDIFYGSTYARYVALLLNSKNSFAYGIRELEVLQERPADQCELTITYEGPSGGSVFESSGGGITGGSQVFYFQKNSTVTLTAMEPTPTPCPCPQLKFSCFIDGPDTIYDSNYSFTITEDKKITARFYTSTSGVPTPGVSINSINGTTFQSPGPIANVELSVNFYSTFYSINEARLYLNDVLIETILSPVPSSIDFSFPVPAMPGDYTIKVEADNPYKTGSDSKNFTVISG